MATEGKAKREGDISSVFSSLSGGEATPLDPRFAEIKKKLIQGHEQRLLSSWKRLLRRLTQENSIVAQRGSSIIPQIDFAELSSRPRDFEQEVKFRGAAVIKGVMPRDEARACKREVEEYIKANPSTKGFPPNRPAVFELYWSEPQTKARAHPNMIAAQKHLMSLWHSNEPQAPISTSRPLTYADRLRIRQPGDAGFALGPHLDGGSVERWEPDGYGRGHVYDNIFSGNWERYDPWESSCRLPAVSSLYDSAGGCSVFRMFQGWLSMSETGPNEGTLMVNPLLQLSTAYILLRPFFAPLREAKIYASGQADVEYLHEDNWVLEREQSSTLHGATPGMGQELNTILHPHLDLANTMVHIPRIQPGDYVVWHCDTIHAVDKKHRGTSDSSVMYIPVCPLTESNVGYLARQRDAFTSGLPAPDFPGGKGESEHRGRPTVDHVRKNLGSEGLQAMGLAKLELDTMDGTGGSITTRANAILGY